MTIFIYALSDPRTGVVRYIGKTASPENRLASHLRRAKNGCTTHCRRWIAALIREGIVPSMKIIAKAKDQAEANELERAWIAKESPNGTLTNLTVGGDGRAHGSKLTMETRLRMSEARKGKPLLESFIQASAASKRGIPRPQHVKDAVSKANKGRKQTPEQIEKRVSKTRGRAPRPAGWKHTEEAKRKIGEASKARRNA